MRCGRHAVPPVKRARTSTKTGYHNNILCSTYNNNLSFTLVTRKAHRCTLK